jgi:hypothetical protein
MSQGEDGRRYEEVLSPQPTSLGHALDMVMGPLSHPVKGLALEKLLDRG